MENFVYHKKVKLHGGKGDGKFLDIEFIIVEGPDGFEKYIYPDVLRYCEYPELNLNQSEYVSLSLNCGKTHIYIRREYQIENRRFGIYLHESIDPDEYAKNFAKKSTLCKFFIP
jgi:hypothetical protein